MAQNDRNKSSHFINQVQQINTFYKIIFNKSRNKYIYPPMLMSLRRPFASSGLSFGKLSYIFDTTHESQYLVHTNVHGKLHLFT